ncbi:MAG: hypothetical protein JWM93_518 [Frankiales bacterium]|nr:hypothetical protein [Frankiales bacterium]
MRPQRREAIVLASMSQMAVKRTRGRKATPHAVPTSTRTRAVGWLSCSRVMWRGESRDRDHAAVCRRLVRRSPQPAQSPVVRRAGVDGEKRRLSPLPARSRSTGTSSIAHRSTSFRRPCPPRPASSARCPGVIKVCLYVHHAPRGCGHAGQERLLPLTVSYGTVHKVPRCEYR